jgi:hypothetical protein
MISSYPQTSSSPYELLVAQGAVSGARSITVFGYSPDVDQTEVTVWPLQSILTHQTSAVAVKVSSTSASDTSAGVGARSVFINGLDVNHVEITETVVLNGTTAVTTTQSFLHINSAYVATAGSTNGAVGDIYIGTGVVTAGIPAVVLNVIKYDFNNTVTGNYTIPAGYTGYIMQGLFSAGQVSGSTSIRGRLVNIGNDNITRTVAITTLNNGSVDYVFEYPIPIYEKTSIEARAVGSANNNSASCMFVMLLIKNS